MKIKRPLIFLFFVILINIGFSVAGLCTEKEPDYYLTGAIDNHPMVKSDTFFVKKGQTLFLKVVPSGSGKAQDKFDPAQYSVVWYRISPVLKQYSNLWSGQNTEAGNIHLEPIEYQKTPLPRNTGKITIDLVEIIKKKGFGTYYFSAELRPKSDLSKIKANTFSTPGLIHKKPPYKIVQIAYRPDDSYLGFLCELLNTPFIIAPMSSTGGFHQTDSRCGSDCAAFAVYGKRRQGAPIAYAGPRGIYKYLRPIEQREYLPVPSGGTEVFADQKGNRMEVGKNGIQPGDVVHFGEQVSVFYQDKGIIGTLDRDDILFQSFRNSPHLTTLADSGFYRKSVKFFKWIR